MRKKRQPPKAKAAKARPPAPPRKPPRKPIAPDHARLTVEQFAELVGASVQAVEAWRAKGLPVLVEKPTGRPGRPRLRIDLATASDWMIANGVGGFGNDKLAAARPAGNPLITDPDSISDEPGLAGAVQRIYAAERYSFHLLRDALNGRNSLRIAAALENWREAAKALSDLERRHTQRAALEADIQAATQQAVREWCEPKRAYIDTLRHSFASRFLNLKKTAEADAVLNELVASLLHQLSLPLKFNTDNEPPDPR